MVGAAEDPVLDDRTWGDHPGHLPSHEPLREACILHLVADRDLVPLSNEAPEVGIDGVVRDPGHRDPDALGVRGSRGEDHVDFPSE